MEPESFSLSEMISNDDGLPVRITHHRDIGPPLAESGPRAPGDWRQRFKRDDNRIDYIFAIEGQEVTASFHVEGRMSVHVDVPRAALCRPSFAAVLAYLQRRFHYIHTQEGGEWRMAYAYGHMPGPAPVDEPTPARKRPPWQLWGKW